MTAKKLSLGIAITQFALGVFFIASGVLSLLHGGSEIHAAVSKIVSGDIAKLISLALSICEIFTGALLIIRFFGFVGKIADILLVIVLIVWLAIIICLDVFGTNGIAGGVFKTMDSALEFLRTLGTHLLVVGGLVLVKRG